MITRFGSLFAGHVDLDNEGLDGTPVNDRWLSDEHLADGVRQERGHRQADGPDRLRHLLAGRAPLPARGLRVHPERADAGRAPLPPHQEHQDRLRLQHRADVASDPAGRGLRHRRLADRRPGRLRRRARLPHPRGRGLRRADARSGRQPRAVRGAGRDHLQVVQRAGLLAPGQALHDPAARCRIAATSCEEITLVPRPKTLPVECWQPVVSASPRALDFMAKHGIKGIIGGGAAPGGANEKVVHAFREARARAGRETELGERPLHRLLVPHRRQRGAGDQGGDAVLRGEDEDVRAARLRARASRPSRSRRSPIPKRARQANLPTLRNAVKAGTWLIGPPELITEQLMEIQAQVPGPRGRQRRPAGRHAAGGDPRAARALLGRGHAGLQEEVVACRGDPWCAR